MVRLFRYPDFYNSSPSQLDRKNREASGYPTSGIPDPTSSRISYPYNQHQVYLSYTESCPHLQRLSIQCIRSKIEKVPRGIRGEKTSKDMASSRNLVSTIGAQASPTMGTEPGVRKGKRSLPACHTRCKCSMVTTHNR